MLTLYYSLFLFSLLGSRLKDDNFLKKLKFIVSIESLPTYAMLEYVTKMQEWMQKLYISILFRINICNVTVPVYGRFTFSCNFPLLDIRTPNVVVFHNYFIFSDIVENENG